MTRNDIRELSDDGARAYAPFTAADLQRAYEEAEKTPDPVSRSHSEDAVVDLPF